ncbi:hypothetical protein E4T56_gene2894 [Termitomyces sp. T112]|nr:hypothetical protein E4T56_gene2894 [Termitomyces sp. T112]
MNNVSLCLFPRDHCEWSKQLEGRVIIYYALGMAVIKEDHGTIYWRRLPVRLCSSTQPPKGLLPLETY